MKRKPYGWFLTLAASVALSAVPVLAQQKGDEPGRVNAAKQVQPVNNQGESRTFDDQLRAEGVEPGRGAAVQGTRTQTQGTVRREGAAPATAPGAAPAQVQPAARGARNDNVQQQLDSDIASCLILANQNEVAIAKFAASKTQNDDVKKFAEMLEKDHSAMIAKLQKFTSHTHADRDTTRENLRSEIRSDNRETRETIREERAENREKKAEATTPAEVRKDNRETREAIREDRAENRVDRAQDRAAATQIQVQGGGTRVEVGAAGNNNASGNELLAIHRQMKQEMADQCLADTKKELSSKESNRFDECFVGMQIAGHMHMATELKVVRKHVSSEFEQVLAGGLQTTEEHLKHAKSLIEDLTKGSK